MSLTPIIIDTNILFSALLRRDTKYAHFIFNLGYPVFICESVIVELFEHKEKIVKSSRLSEAEMLEHFYALLRRLIIYKEVLIEPSIRQTAYELCVEIDVSDTPHIALTLQCDGLLWTGDNTLKTGLRKKGFDNFFEPS